MKNNTTKRYGKLAHKTRQVMIEQGLRPEILKEYLQETITLQNKKFSHELSERERELRLLQGELLLAVIDRCCLG